MWGAAPAAAGYLGKTRALHEYSLRESDLEGLRTTYNGYCNSHMYSRVDLDAASKRRKEADRLEEERELAVEKALEDKHGGKEGLKAFRAAEEAALAAAAAEEKRQYRAAKAAQATALEEQRVTERMSVLEMLLSQPGVDKCSVQMLSKLKKKEAKEAFSLTEKDFKLLPFTKEGSSNMYPASDVLAACLAKHGPRVLEECKAKKWPPKQQELTAELLALTTKHPSFKPAARKKALQALKLKAAEAKADADRARLVLESADAALRNFLGGPSSTPAPLEKKPLLDITTTSSNKSAAAAPAAALKPPPAKRQRTPKVVTDL